MEFICYTRQDKHKHGPPNAGSTPGHAPDVQTHAPQAHAPPAQPTTKEKKKKKKVGSQCDLSFSQVMST